MAVLGDARIARQIRQNGLVSGMDKDDQIQPASVDMTVGNTFLFPVRPNCGAVEVGSCVEYRRISVDDNDAITIYPGEFLLGTTRETVTLPMNIAAQVDGRSSMARIGLMVHVTAGWIDPGFSGKVTLELHNVAPYPIRIRPGDRIAQIVFMDCDDCVTGYNGHYQHQDDTTGSRMHEKID